MTDKLAVWLDGRSIELKYLGRAENVISVTLIPFSKNVYLISVGQKVRPNCCKRNANSFVYLGFCWRDIPENSHKVIFL